MKLNDGITRKDGKHVRLYRIWIGIKTRCLNANNKAYPKYGGRGITICNDWINNFKSFREWALQNGYADNLTIDRIDVNGNYEPENCRWITLSNQSNNRSTSHYLTYNGITKTMGEFAKEYNLSIACLHRRIKAGWDVEKALTEKVETKYLPKNK